MKIVIIGFWTYPKKTPRAFRTWNLAEGFAAKGHEVILYSYTGGKDYDEETKGLFKVKNLGDCSSWVSSSIHDHEYSIIDRILMKLVGEPDVYPYKKCYPHIKTALQQEGEIDLLISVAYPHVVHWAVEKYIDRRKVKTWVADCGDPFMGNPFQKHRASLEKVERAWCEKVDYIAIPIKEGMQAYYLEYQNKIKIIPQGFDVENVEIAEYEKNRIPTFCFAGIVYPNQRDPRELLEYIYKKNLNVKFVVYSKNSIFYEYQRMMPEKIDIRGLVERDVLIKEMSKMDFLLNVKNINGVQAPSKLIDYTLAKRPILDISTHFTDEEKNNFKMFMTGDYSNQHMEIDISQFSIKKVCDDFIGLCSL